MSNHLENTLIEINGRPWLEGLGLHDGPATKKRPKGEASGRGLPGLDGGHPFTRPLIGGKGRVKETRPELLYCGDATISGLKLRLQF